MSDRRFGTIVEIGNILVSEDVVTEFFCCDYPVCQGRCCIAGDGGAPLEEAELELLERDYGRYSPLMTEAGRAAVQAKGFFEVDIEGDIVTSLVPLTHECAYSYLNENGDCLCAIEHCFLAGGCRFRKPQSCRLYPIRVTKLTGGGLALNLHRWDICQAAYEKGRREGIRVYQFLRETLTELYGADFYEALDAAAAMILRES